MSNNPYVKIKKIEKGQRGIVKKIKIIAAAVVIDIVVTAVMAVGVYLTL